MHGMNFEQGMISPLPDVPAFHEAFKDLVAIFMHFAPSDVLRAQINAIDGWLDRPSTLGVVGLQLGQALGMRDGLRNAFGQHDDKGNWIPRQPNVQLYQQELEPHARGDILVSAMFEAFQRIFNSRVADLRRLADRSGNASPGSLHRNLSRP